MILIFLLIFQLSEFETCLETKYSEEIDKAVEACNIRISENQNVIDKCTDDFNKLSSDYNRLTDGYNKKVVKISALKKRIKRMRKGNN
jgi:hypothetical protein